MELLQTARLRPTPAGIARAARILRAGGLVAFPTETVYGLGANALDARAVGRIFQAKGRPADDPLIVHLASSDALDLVARPSPAARRLAERFWPGPLTLVLPRQPAVPNVVTAGLPTVGVRVPAHPVARALLEASGVPIAAPSANLFTHPSPTTAAHVLQDLDGRIEAVLDGGSTTVGVESTIVDLTSDPPRLLRPGGLPPEEVEAVLRQRLLPPPAPTEQAGPQVAPGLLEKHYAPRTPLWLVRGPSDWARRQLLAEADAALERGQRVGLLLAEEDRPAAPAGAVVEVLGPWGDAPAAARRLYGALRALDRAGCDLLLARDVADPDAGLGRALADRLRRASRRVIRPSEGPAPGSVHF